MQASLPLGVPQTGLPDYAELYCRTNFSFLQGASHAQELVDRAIELGYRALAITDECTMAGVVRAHAAWMEQVHRGKAKDFKLLIGSCFRFTALKDEPAHPLARMTLVALARNREGYGNLCELITLARTRAEKGSYLLSPEDLSQPPPALSHLRALPDCQLILVPDYPADEETLDAQLRWFAPLAPGRSWVGMTRLYRPLDDLHRAAIDAAARLHGLPLAAVGDVQMHQRSRKYLQDVVTAIRVGKPVQECGLSLAPNAEQHLRPRMRLSLVHSPATLAQTLAVAAWLPVQPG